MALICVLKVVTEHHSSMEYWKSIAVSGAPWRIHLSWTTHDKLEEAGGYQMQFRGMTELKGKGNHPTYWLLGKDGFNKSLPIPPEIG